MIFDGRTPCQPFATDYNLSVGDDCFKLKWRVTLNRDPQTLLPTTYMIQRTNIRETPVTGKWTIVQGFEFGPFTQVYTLDPDKADSRVYLFAGDTNVLFLLDHQWKFYVGDEHFSFTLNRVRPVKN